MAEPGGGEIRLRIWMALLAGTHKVIFYHRRMWVTGELDVMHAMAIDTDRLIGLLAWYGGLEDHGCAVEIGYIAVEHVRADTIFCHQGLICVAFGTDQRRGNVELLVRWSGDIVYSMAVNAGRHILIVFIDQGCPMYTFLVTGVNLGVAALAGAHNAYPIALLRLDIMHTMAVGANGGLLVTIGQGVGMHAVPGLFSHTTMAARTRLGHGNGEIATVFDERLGMWEFSFFGVALDAGIPLAAVD